MKNNIFVLSHYNAAKMLYWITLTFVLISIVYPIAYVMPGKIIFATPNVIAFIVAAIILCIILILILLNAIKYNGLIASSALVFAYFGYLLLTCLWAEYPESTITRLKFDLVNIFIFLLFFLFSLNNRIEQVRRIFIATIIPSLVVIVAGYLINPELRYLGFGNSINFLALSATFVTYSIFTDKSKTLTYCILLLLVYLSLIASMRKTPLFIACLGFVLVVILGWRHFKVNRQNLLLFLTVPLLFLLVLFVSKDFQELSLQTYSRVTGKDISYGDIYIVGEGVDTVRENIFDYANELIKDNWVLGIGYMNFAPHYGRQFNYYFVTPTGKEIAGMSVHNTFQALLLEGGLPLVTIMLLIFIRYFDILRQQINLSKNKKEIFFYKVLVVIMIQLMVWGVYHQLHQGVLLWMMLGLVFAEKHKKSSYNSSACWNKPG